MYGFPLTVYLLTGLFGIDTPICAQTGHLWASLLGYGMTGAAIEMLLGGLFIVLGLWLLIVGWQQVYRAREERRMAVGGIYVLMRHLQYTGIILAVFGQIVHWPTIVTVALFPFIVFVYARLARKEEREMLRRFGRAYQDHLDRTPMFAPRWRKLSELFTVLTDSVLP